MITAPEGGVLCPFFEAKKIQCPCVHFSKEPRPFFESHVHFSISVHKFRDGFEISSTAFRDLAQFPAI